MPKSHAERQRDYRERQRATDRHQADRISGLEAELDAVRTELDAALAEIERLSTSQCKHPAGAVDGATCRACGAEVW